jgi:two-component sensor histidine kinase/ligand-binding sensor domain-containing protein
LQPFLIYQLGNSLFYILVSILQLFISNKVYIFSNMFGKNNFLQLKGYIIYFLISMQLCFSKNSNAQNIEIEHKYYTVEDGLPGRTINHITQDSSGYIWLATNKGICKFNGYTFENYNKLNGLRQEDVKAIYFISNEIAWIKYNLLDYNCFDVFNTKTLTITPFLEYYKNKLSNNLLKNINSITLGSNNNFYLGLNDSLGLIKFTNNVFTYNRLPYKMLLLNTNSNNSIYCFEIRNKRILQFNYNLQLIDSTTHSTLAKKLLSRYFFPYSEDYFSYSESIQSVNTKTDIQFNKLLKQIDTRFFCTYLNKKQFVINDYKIYDNNNAKEIFNFSQIDKSIQSVSNPIHSKYISANGTIWVGLEFGLLQINILEKKFNTLLNNLNKQERSIAIRGMAESNKNNLFIHTENLAKYAVRLNQNKTPIIKELPSNEFNYALASNNGAVYFIDNKQNNLNIIDSNGTTKALFKVDFRDWNWSLTFIKETMIWAGTEGQGLFSVDLEKKTTKAINYNQFPELKNATIYQIKKINDDWIWICSNRGLYKANTSSGIVERFYNEGKGKYFLPTNNISFIELSGNIIWLATLDNGLIKFNTSKGLEKVFTKNQGFPTQTIYAAYKDAHQSIWMPSDKGIIQFNTKTEEVYRIYTTKDGVTNNEFNRIAHYRAHDSSLFFGGLSGVTYFHPRNFTFQDNISAYNLVVEQAKIYNGASGNFLNVEQFISNKQEIKLSANDRFLTLQLALLSYTNTDKIQYAYKLDNDSNWTFQNNRVIQFAGLSWGKHTITIRAKDENGVWSKNAIYIQIYQLKPFYLQAWFLASIVVVIGVAFFIVFKTRLNKVEQQKKELSSIVYERTKELNASKNELLVLLQQKEVLLKEIHHRVKNNLTVISSLLELQSDNTLDENAKATLLQSTNRVRSIALIHQKLYQHQNFASIELHEFVNDLYKQIASVMSNTNATIIFRNNIQNIPIDIDTSVPLGLIINELITNSFKYAFINNQQPLIQVKLNTLTKDFYEFVYIDNGKGLPKDFKVEEATSLGMQLMYMLATQLSGSLFYERKDDLSIFTITFKTTEARSKE